MSMFGFDDRNVRWQTLAGIDHLHFWVLGVDENAKIADLVFRFASNQRIMLHRHKALNHTFVLQGEHRLYYADGTIKDIRPVGRYTVTPPDVDTHREGGGAGQDTVVHFSIRGSDGLLYELLDDEQNIVGTLTFEDIKALLKAQNAGREGANAG